MIDRWLHGPREASGPATPDALSLLSVENLTVRFGGLLALDDVSFHVEPGAFLGIIGPNGAGKTTLFNAISRLVPVAAGSIAVGGRSILGARPSQIARTGVARTFQNLGIFPSLTVGDNIVAGGLSHLPISLIADVLGTRSASRPRRELIERSREIARLCRLDREYDQSASALPWGVQKRVELARALATAPTILLLDEPAGGLSHHEIEAFFDLLQEIKASLGLTIIMIEHHLALVMRASYRIVVLNFGRKIAEGTPEAVQRDPEVIAAYLGSRA